MLQRFWDRLNPSQVVALAIFVAGVVTSIVCVPPHLVEKIVELDWKAAGGFVVAMLAALRMVFGDRIIRRKLGLAGDSLPPDAMLLPDPLESLRPPAPGTTEIVTRPDSPLSMPPIPGKREGFAAVDALAVTVCAAVLALLAAVAIGGCGGAQSIVSTQATILVANRAARIELYESEAARCRAASPDFAQWETCMVPAIAVQRAADAYRDVLSAAQSAIDAGNGNEANAIACAIEGAAHLARALESAGVPVPAEVTQVVALVPGGVCAH